MSKMLSLSLELGNRASEPFTEERPGGPKVGKHFLKIPEGVSSGKVFAGH